MLLRPSVAPVPSNGSAATAPSAAPVTSFTVDSAGRTGATGNTPVPGGGIQTTTAGRTTASETAGQTETGRKISAALKDLGLQPDVSAKIVPTEIAPHASPVDGFDLPAVKNDLLVTDTGTVAIPDGVTLIPAGAGQPTPSAQPAAKAVSNQTATAADTAKQTAVALNGLGLQPEASAKVAPAETTSNADKIAGTYFTAAKNDPSAPRTENGVNTGVSTKSTVQAALISNGTLVAKDEIPMKKAETTNQAAGPTEKVLPGQNVSAARVSNLLRAGSASASSNDQPTATNIISLSSVMDRNANAAGNPDAVAVANLSDIQARAMERTHDMVTNNALRLVSTQSDTMQVVLKPGAGTELSLELRQRGGIIEAQAVLQHGDYQNLSQHWPDLQQRLEQKGIRLAALASDENSLPFNGNEGNSKNQESSEHGSAVCQCLCGIFVGRRNVHASQRPLRTCAQRSL